jgi:GGDEF domain-containing protein
LDQKAMSEQIIAAIGELSEQRFGGFSDAARSVLSFLERQLPEGAVALGEFNYDDDQYRLLDIRGGWGEGLSVSTRIPLRQAFCVHMAEEAGPELTGAASSDPLYGGLELRRLLAVESYAGAAIELGDGARVASVFAISPERDHYGESDLSLLKLAARWLGYEWDRVTREAKLRRLLRDQASPAASDPVTGLAHRPAFLEHLEREWHASHRLITESYVVALQLVGLDAVRRQAGAPAADLALRRLAEVLTAANRRSDIIGRVADDRFCSILVGCKGTQGADAYCARVRAAFGRSLGDEQGLELRCRIEALADSLSGAAALERAERQLDEQEVAGISPAANQL